MAEKDEEEPDDHEDGTEDTPPGSILRHVPRRGPPSAAELRDVKSKLHAIDDDYTRLVAFKTGAHDIGPESRTHLHQDVLTRFWAPVKQYGVPFDLSATLTAITWGTLDKYRRRRERAVQRARASWHEPIGAGWLAEPSARFLVLLNEAAALLPTGDADLRRRVGLEGDSYEEIAERLAARAAAVAGRAAGAVTRLPRAPRSRTRSAPCRSRARARSWSPSTSTSR
jgi:DNA-directed RNA polymerase specialized sigma24 family protein